METNVKLVLALLILSASLPGYVYDHIDDIYDRKVQKTQQTVDFLTAIYGKVMQCLREQVPEIDNEWTDYVSDESGGKAYICIRLDDLSLFDVYRDYKKKEYLGKYYLIYVGEQWEDYSTMWAYFYVNENFDEVLWCDVVMGKDSEYPVLYLNEWRTSIFYPQLNN